MKEICQKIYALIKSEAGSAGTLSVRDICTRLQIKSTSTVHRYLNELEEIGLICRTNDKHRYITLPSAPTCQVPVIGTITAGQPITAIEEIEGYIPLADFHGDSSDLFALNVHGDSMIEAGILDGDIVILRQTPVAENGQIVAAMMDGEATGFIKKMVISVSSRKTAQWNRLLWTKWLFWAHLLHCTAATTDFMLAFFMKRDTIKAVSYAS